MKNKDSYTDDYKLILVLVFTFFSVILTYDYHFILGKTIVFTPLFYIPIIMATFWFRRKGMSVPIFLATFIILSHFISPKLTDPLIDDFIRVSMFIVVGIVVTILSERIEDRENRLKASEEKFRSVANSALDGIATLSLDGKIIYSNESFNNIFGHAKDNLNGTNILDLIYSDDKTQLKTQLKYIRETSKFKGYKTEFYGIKKDGSRFPFEVSVSEWHTTHDRFVTTIVRDISERKNAETYIRDYAVRQFSIAKISQIALVNSDINQLMNLIVEEIVKTLKVDYCKILELLDDKKFLLRAGRGWKKGIVGRKKISSGHKSQAGYTLLSSKPVIVTDLSKETRFKGPDLLFEHGVVSGVSVIIGSQEDPFGVLGVHSTKKRDFDDDEVNFIQSMANVLATSIERRSMEEKLKSSEKRYRLIAENASDMISRHDLETNYLFVSPACKHVLNYEPDELVGHSAFEFIHPDDWDLTKKTLKDVLTKKDITSVTYRIRKKNGLYTWIESTAKALHDPHSGSVIEIIVSSRDVSERKKAEKDLKESEAYYRTIFENTGTATIIVEEDMTVSLANTEFEKLYGYKREEIEGRKKWTEFVADTHLEAMLEYHEKRRIDPDSAPRNYEFKFVNRNGEIKDVLTTVAIIPSTSKSLVSLLDITERKQSRIALERELKIQKALERIYEPLISPKSSIKNITDSVLEEAERLTDSLFGYAVVIDNAGKITNYSISSLDNVLSVKDLEIKLKKNAEGKYDGLLGRSLNTKKSFYLNEIDEDIEFSGLKNIKDLKFLSAPVMLANELVGQISLFKSDDYSENDLAAVKRLCEFYSLAIQRMHDEDKIKRSLRDKELLLREIHHRVKNNLQIVTSLLNLQSRKIDDNEAVDVFKESQNRVKSMAIIHEQLYQSADLAYIDFELYIKQLISYLSDSYNVNRYKIKTEIIADSISLNIDTAMPLALIINELVSNSLKYAFPDSEEGNIRVELKKEDGMYKLTVSDDGIGLPEDISVENTKTLGLQLIHSLTMQLDGEITVDLTNGTKFNIRFKELKYENRL
ncbi:MAG: PAS domain S-box protein [Methanobacteriaceae archaeon]|nr:PAS domain S-box protein [Methanobacteriaceae archaeon]